LSVNPVRADADARCHFTCSQFIPSGAPIAMLLVTKSDATRRLKAGAKLTIKGWIASGLMALVVGHGGFLLH
jgi:hypothetical protein